MTERRDFTGDSCRYSIEYSRRVVLVFLAVRSFSGCVFYANVAIVVFLLEYASGVRKAEVARQSTMAGIPPSRRYTCEEVLGMMEAEDDVNEPLEEGSDDDLGMDMSGSGSETEEEEQRYAIKYSSMK